MNSLPSFIWVFYVLIPVVGFVATVLTVVLSNKKSEDL